ncbi:MAG: hypothetical protein H7Y27_12800, partial [Gemmatimonadaceae bacterium]|nr:hypothetical protein [Chitinophagaceae bacterium]
SGENLGLVSVAAVLVIRFASPLFVLTQISPPYVKAIFVLLIAGWRSSLVPCAQICVHAIVIKKIGSNDLISI